jgi:riboflavin kinase/FMN adenylyltransferase
MTESLETTKPFAVVRGAAPVGELDGAVVAIGNSMGVHRGHRAVIAAARAARRRLAGGGGADLRAASAELSSGRQGSLFRLTDERGSSACSRRPDFAGAIVLRFDAALAGSA